MIHILLVDDHTSFRQALAFMLEREADCTVVAQAGSLAEGQRVLQAGRQVDVAVVDLDLGDGHGEALIRALRVAKPQARVLTLTGTCDRGEHARALEAGAEGVLQKAADIAEILAVVRRLARGEPVLAMSEVLALLQEVAAQRERDRAAHAALGRLTQREREVLAGLADGLTDRAVAARLRLRTETVRTHLVHLLRKLGVESRLQAVVFAIRHGAVTIR